MKFRLCIIVLWFGKWPDWIDLFFRSCANNGDIDFLVFTDCEVRKSSQATNITIVNTDLHEISARIRDEVGLSKNSPVNAYKLCDYKPLLGVALKEYLVAYTHWGVCDSDLVFGNLRRHINKSTDVFSTHAKRLSGHFFYIRNEPILNNSYKLIKNWREKFSAASHLGLDEGEWSDVLMPRSLKDKAIRYVRNPFSRKLAIIDEELFTTPHSKKPWVDGTFEYPEYWLYENGTLIAVKDDVRTHVPYVHFMNWKSGAKWLPKWFGKPLWEGVDLSACANIWMSQKIKIDKYGFTSVIDSDLERSESTC